MSAPNTRLPVSKPLVRAKGRVFHYVSANLIQGPSPELRGDCSGLSGNCSGLRGDCSGLSGDCSGLSGNCSGLSGDLDQIPAASRPCDIADWVEQDFALLLPNSPRHATRTGDL